MLVQFTNLGFYAGSHSSGARKTSKPIPYLRYSRPRERDKKNIFVNGLQCLLFSFLSLFSTLSVSLCPLSRYQKPLLSVGG